MPLDSTDTDLVGRWLEADGKIVAEATENRINELIRTELQRIAADWSGWEILYRDPSDGRFWELTFPHNEMHGGGPRRLRVLDPAMARQKYKLD